MGHLDKTKRKIVGRIAYYDLVKFILWLHILNFTFSNVYILQLATCYLELDLAVQ